MFKTCTVCNKEKELNAFYKIKSASNDLRPECKICCIEASKKYQKDHPENTKRLKREGYKRNKTIILEKQKKYIELHKEEKKERDRAYYLANSEKIKINAKLYASNNKEKIKSTKKLYVSQNREKINKYYLEKSKKDLNFKLKSNLRKRLGAAIKYNSKSGSAVSDLGCSVEFLKQYLESKFQSGMNWENWGQGEGTWQLDHIVPLCSFDLRNRDQFLKANHYTNLQPLWYKDHLSKSIEDNKLAIQLE